MNWRAIRAIIRKDLKVVRQSRAVMLPIIIVPLLLLVILPAAGGILISSTDINHPEIQEFRTDMETFFDNMPDSIRGELDALDNELQQLVVVAFMYFFAPMFLILPMMVANVMAADSFVGEKERKTLEALIYTPTTDKELFIAKLLGPFIMAVLVSFVGLAAYGIVVNVTTMPVMERIFFPNLAWVILGLWVSPATAGLGLGAMVLVSSRVNTFQEAYQIGSLVVVPVILLLFGQMGGVIYFSPMVVFVLGVLLWTVDALIFLYGARSFQRGVLMVRL